MIVFTVIKNTLCRNKEDTCNICDKTNEIDFIFFY